MWQIKYKFYENWKLKQQRQPYFCGKKITVKFNMHALTLRYFVISM